MGVIREQRQSGSIGPIGTVNLNTGGVEKYNSISKAANSMFEIALNEMSRSSAKEGADRAAAVSSSKITTVNPITGRPEALDDFNADMFLGRTAGEAYERVITDRFNTEISNDIKVKANELTTKYQDNPNNIQIVSEALGEYVKNLAFGSERNGKPTLFTNFIEDNGKVEIANAKMTLTKLNHQRQKEQLANDLLEANQSDLLTAYEAGKSFLLDGATEEEARLSNTVSDFENWMESRVAKNTDGVEARLLKSGADKQHEIALKTAFISGRIEKLMPTLYGNPIQRQIFLLAVQTNGENPEILNKLSPDLIPELQSILKFTTPETKDGFIKYISGLDSELGTLEAREKAVLTEQQNIQTAKDKEEEDFRKSIKKIGVEKFKIDLSERSDLKTSEIYGKAAIAYNLFYQSIEAGPMSFEIKGAQQGTMQLVALLESAAADIGRLTFTLDGFVNDPEIMLKAETRNEMIKELRQSYLKGFMALGMEDGNADAFASAIIGEGNREGLTRFQSTLIDLLNGARLYKGDDRAELNSYVKQSKNNIKQMRLDFQEHSALITATTRLSSEARRGAMTSESFAELQQNIMSSNLTKDQKRNLINEIKLSAAEGVINVLVDPDATELNAMQLYIDSDGTSKDDAIDELSPESLAIAQAVVEISATVPNAKSRITKVLRGREEIIRQQEAEAEALLKDETKKLENRKSVFNPISQKTKAVREEADNILEQNGIVSPVDESSLNPLFYAVNANTLTQNTIEYINSFMDGRIAFSEQESEIMLRHLQRFTNDIISYKPNADGLGIDEGNYGVPINRLRGVDGISNTTRAQIKELIARKEYYGDRRSAAELLLEMRAQADSKESQINVNKVFSDDRGKSISEEQFVAATLSLSNPNVLADLAPIAKMYAQMGYNAKAIKEKIKVEFKENYHESQYVIDLGLGAAFFEGKQYSKLALTRQFPDPDQRREFIRLINESLPREFRVGPPQPLGYTISIKDPDSKRRADKEFVQTGMTKEVFLVPVEGAEFEAPQYYAYFKDDDGELRPLIYEDAPDDFGAETGKPPTLMFPMFDGTITEDFMRNKFEEEQKQLLIEAEEAFKKANTPLFSNDVKIRFGIFKSLGIPLSGDEEYGDRSGFLFVGD